MPTNTPTPESDAQSAKDGTASMYKVHTVGAADEIGDVPDKVKRHSSDAEATVVLEQMLGFRIANLNRPENEILQQIETRIFSLVRDTRALIGRDELRSTLAKNLSEALEQLTPGLKYKTANERQRIQALSQAAYESLPSDMQYEVGLMSAPVHFAIAHGRPSSIVHIPLPGITMNGVGTIEVDFGSTFWRSNNFRNVSEIESNLVGKKGSEVGLVHANLQEHVLTSREAKAIATTKFDVISISPTHVANLDIGEIDIAGVKKPLFVKMDALYRAETSYDAPAGLQNRKFAEMTSTKIVKVLKHRGEKGDYPYWRTFIDPSDGDPNDTVKVTLKGTKTLVSKKRVTVVSQALQKNMAPSSSLGERKMTALSAHADVRSQHEKFQRLMDQLVTNSENQGGAALALSFAASNADTMKAATASTDEEKAKKSLNDARSKVEMHEYLTAMQSLQFSPTMQKFQVLSAPLTLEGLENEMLRLSADGNAIAGKATAASWTSDYLLANQAQWQVTGGPADLAEKYNPTNRRDDNELSRKETASKIGQRMTEISEELKRYEQITSVVSKIAKAAIAANMLETSAGLSKYVDKDGKPKKVEFTPTTDVPKLFQEISKDLGLGSKQDLEAAVKLAEEALKKTKEGGEKGDALQQKIFEAHFKNQGLSTAEAQRSANYLYTRSLLDDEHSSQQEALMDDMFSSIGHVGESKDVRNRGSRSLQFIYSTLGISSDDRETNEVVPMFIYRGMLVTRTKTTYKRHYHWDNAPYRTLVTAYFSMKKVYEGTAPDAIAAPGSQAVQKEMHTIAKVLARRHAHMIVNDLGNDLPDEDRKNLGSRKSLAVETLEQYLTGEAPEKYNARIAAILYGAEAKNANRFAPRVAKLASGILNIGTQASVVTFDKGKVATNWTWGQRKNIATLGLFTALGGPLGVAAFMGMKAMSGGSSSN